MKFSTAFIFLVEINNYHYYYSDFALLFEIKQRSKCNSTIKSTRTIQTIEDFKQLEEIAKKRKQWSKIIIDMQTLSA
jgi:hypothetical protein